MSLQSPERIERREFKFLIPPALADEVRARLPAFCELDPFAAPMPQHRYAIESLYFDTWNLALCHANDHERMDRFKLRARHYPDHPGGPVFLEVKRRYHDAIIKTRGKIAVDKWQRVLDDPWCSAEDLRDPRVERFVAMVHHWQARPITLVRYHREAWASVIDEYARVTFDTRVCSQIARGVSFDHDPNGWRAHDHAEGQKTLDSRVVLELKFVSQAPSWMINIVQRLDLWRRAFSKYGTSVSVWYDTTPTNRAALA